MTSKLIEKHIQAITKIEGDLSDRSGMGWDGIDADIQEEIREKWAEILNEVYG